MITSSQQLSSFNFISDADSIMSSPEYSLYIKNILESLNKLKISLDIQDFNSSFISIQVLKCQFQNYIPFSEKFIRDSRLLEILFSIFNFSNNLLSAESIYILSKFYFYNTGFISFIPDNFQIFLSNFYLQTRSKYAVALISNICSEYKEFPLLEFGQVFCGSN